MNFLLWARTFSRWMWDSQFLNSNPSAPPRNDLLSLDSSALNIFWKFQILIYGVRYFPKGISQVTISQVATTQMCNFQSGNFPKVRLGPLRRRRLQWRVGPSAAATINLESCRLGNCTFGKLPLGKISNSLGKYIYCPIKWKIGEYIYFFVVSFLSNLHKKNLLKLVLGNKYLLRKIRGGGIRNFF